MSVVSQKVGALSSRGKNLKTSSSDIYVYFKELNERLVIMLTNTYKKYLKTHNALFFTSTLFTKILAYITRFVQSCN